MKKVHMPISDNRNEHVTQRKINRGNLFSRAKRIYERNGLHYFIHTVIRYLYELFFISAPNRAKRWYYNKFRSSETFRFRGKEYHYLFHSYTPTWKNERCVLLPIAWNIIQSYQKSQKNILEIGNVLSYVYSINHDVIDKYEIVDGVINEDIVNFKTNKQYDLILSIFTLQFVGWDETPRNPKKVLMAIENMKSMLAPNGLIIVMHGLGEHKEVDELLKNGSLKFEELFYLMKTSGYKWKEATWEEVRDLPYDHSVPTAIGVVIGLIGTYPGNIFN